MSFEDVARQVFSLYGEQRYDEALAIVRGVRTNDVSLDIDLTFWEACLLAVSGHHQSAIDTLVTGVNRGLWWPPGQLADADLDAIRHLPEWEVIEDRSSAITSEKLIGRPAPIVKGIANPVGTVVSLPGGRANLVEVSATWHRAVPSSWENVTLCATEPTYLKGQWHWSRSLSDNLRTIHSDLVDMPLSRPVVVAGFSIGSEIACRLAREPWVLADGLIAVAPSSFHQFAELRAAATEARIRCLIICGSEDPRRAGYEALESDVSDLPNVSFHLLAGIGHEYPSNLHSLVAEFLVEVL